MTLFLMEALRFGAVLPVLLLLLQEFGALGVPVSAEEDPRTSDSWKDLSGRRGLSMEDLQGGRSLVDLLKHSKSQQFHGLMGRSSGGAPLVRPGRKRNKGEMFVGLMGRRSSQGELDHQWRQVFV